MKKIFEEKFEALEIEVDETVYLLDFDISTVKEIAVAGFDVTKCVDVSADAVAAPILIKYALKKNHALQATDKVANRIWESIQALGDDGDITVNDVLARIINLFAQARDEEAKKAIPAKVDIKKDSSVVVEIGEDKYILQFNREAINNIAKMGFDFAQLLNPSTQIIAVPRFISFALSANLKNFSSKTPTQIYNSLYALTFDEETDYLYADVLNALCVHYDEVKNSAIKNSKAAIVKL